MMMVTSKSVFHVLEHPEGDENRLQQIYVKDKIILDQYKASILPKV